MARQENQHCANCIAHFRSLDHVGHMEQSACYSPYHPECCTFGKTIEKSYFKFSIPAHMNYSNTLLYVLNILELVSVELTDLIYLQILLLPYPSASLYPSIPRYQNSLHHRHFHCSLQARLLQLSLSQPVQVSDHPAPTDTELSCTCCCQSSQIQSHHSHPPVSTLAKDN